MSLAIINIHQRQQDELAHVGTTALLARRHVIKKKVIAIGRLSRQLAVLRAHTELVKKLKRMSDNGKLPLGALSLGEQGLLQAITLLKHTSEQGTKPLVERKEQSIDDTMIASNNIEKRRFDL